MQYNEMSDISRKNSRMLRPHNAYAKCGFTFYAKTAATLEVGPS